MKRSTDPLAPRTTPNQVIDTKVEGRAVDATPKALRPQSKSGGAGGNGEPPRARKPRKATTRKQPGRAGTFPIVGIGASAGGLEALEEFFAHVPREPGVAFVVVQHLDPTHKSMLPELLQRNSPLQVQEASDDVVVEPNRIYIIPPNRDLTLEGSRLCLCEPVSARNQRLAVDIFLRSLAIARGPRCAGVILSGMGSDGTLGLRAIREVGGLVAVQEPSTARSDSMPRSALDDGGADIIAPPGELASRLLAVLRSDDAHGLVSGAADEHGPAINRVVALLRAHTGHDFSLYRKSTALRRIERRMAIHQLPNLRAYVNLLRENPQELGLLFKELLIGVTCFFRDPPVWEALLAHGLPEIFAAHPGGRALRAWVVACSTGEEAYSLAITFQEALEALKPGGRFTLQIFATDVHADAIARARMGFYRPNIAADVSPERLERYFVPEEGGYRVARHIREMVTFAPQNVIHDPPFTRLDILTCRNVLIYFEPELQKKLLPLFHFALNPGGVLMLGTSETVGGFTGLFQAIDIKARIYRRLEGAGRPEVMDFPIRPVPGRSRGQEDALPAVAGVVNLQAHADQLLLKHFAPAAVLVTYQGDIAYISGRTGKYLEPAAGRANWNVHVMARSGLRLELAAALHRAVREKADVVVEEILVDGDGGATPVRLAVHYIDKPEMLRGMLLVVFTDLPVMPEPRLTGDAGSGRSRDLEQALLQAREESQATREEMQGTQEELKSSNEELQSINEELQSTNEELRTSREEMLSMVEALQATNDRLQAKVDELSGSRNDMENLLNSTGMATIFVTHELRLRRYTTHAMRLFKLRPEDAGRHLSDVVTELDYPGLVEDAQAVLDTLVFCERCLSTKDGRSYRVRIMPYRTLANAIDGLVITYLANPATLDGTALTGSGRE